MSFKALEWARQLKLRGSQKPVLSTLAGYADEEGSCFPGQELIAHDTGFSERTVRRSIERLEQQGLVVREHRYDRRGHRTSDRYYLQLHIVVLPDPDEAAPGVDGAPDDPEPDLAASTEMSGAPVDNSPTGQSDRRSICPRLPVNLSTPTGHTDRLLDEPSVEPSEGPSGGAGAPTPGPTCGKHPHGTAKPCRACGDARRAWDTQRILDIAAETEARATHRAERYPADIYCPHLQLRTGDCDACTREARQALTNRFGVPA